MGDDTQTGPVWLRRDDSENTRSAKLGLMIAWSPSEPARVGEIGIVPADGKAWIVGRGDESSEAAPRLRFARLRPSSGPFTRPLEAPSLSRQQLAVRSRDGQLFIERRGRAPLRVNGRGVETAVVRPGDRVTIDRQLVLLCVDRTTGHGPEASAEFPFAEPDPSGMVGESTTAWRVRSEIAFYAQREGHCLVVGPSGSGKELAARAMHALSPRRERPFVARNAATLPAGIIDAELFGNARNYPNAGMRERGGLVGEAEGGTLFLDEIGELPDELQAHLLRLLDHGEYHRLGEDRGRRADLRVVGATNRTLEAIKPDLLARLTLRLRTPGLDERREDVPLLARSVLTRLATSDPSLAARFLADGEPRFDPELVEALVVHDWQTHARELESLLILAMATSTKSYVDLTPAVRERLRSVERELPDRDTIEEALRRAGGNVSVAWQDLGLSSRDALNRLIKKLGIVVRRDRD